MLSAIIESVVFRYAPEVVQPHLVLAACQPGPPCPADQSMGVAEMFPSSMLGVYNGEEARIALEAQDAVEPG